MKKENYLKMKMKHKVVHPNPPVVIFTDGLRISVCKGCTKKENFT